MAIARRLGSGARAPGKDPLNEGHDRPVFRGTRARRAAPAAAVEPGYGPPPAPGREPILNAPWPALALVALIVGGYAVQSRFDLQVAAQAFAFAPAMLAEGRWERLFTALSARHLSRKIGEISLLDDVSFTVFSGEVIAMVGPSGAGKTTRLVEDAFAKNPDRSLITTYTINNTEDSV